MARCHGIVSRAGTLEESMVTYHTHTSICITSASSLALGALHALPLHTNSFYMCQDRNIVVDGVSGGSGLVYTHDISYLT